ncbi:pantoate--beta-alanine ligase [Sphingobium phenoxybenzoativorans]|uniref:Pantothenate synthetase n=1 Tax=Sphingobium phenoxybenzoativorans TaxID=1592790 RepID=A0A975K8J8_9SPHN|nr:pantoate--beta-alanine ligase [Sphingobium phenoxybenzoativorans]QUT06048.1 pantoate--beta-alanine ligase [Sphingobium phenoxybenzoativorans]
MQIIRDLDTLRAAVSALRATGGSIALVPTMGALHEGHMALVAEGAARAEHVVASIFVNPKQFGPNEDLDAYPRQEAQDAAMLKQAGVAILWAPTVDVMYPAGFASTVSVTGVSDELDGAARPGHFDGVATVVTKLFNQVRPDVALFGEKDYQQLAVIRRMVADLDQPLEIVGVPTKRAADGLALSSRNVYLSAEQRKAAVALPDALNAAARRIAGGEAVAAVLAEAVASLAEAGFGPIDYVELRDAATLEILPVLNRPGRLLAAARMGNTRLIDNIAVDPA